MALLLVRSADGQELRPRYDTPSERQAKSEQPQFLTPGGKTAHSITGSAAPAAPVAETAPGGEQDAAVQPNAAVAPAAEQTAENPEVAGPSLHPVHPPRFFSYTSGPLHDFSSEALLGRPRELGRPIKPGHAVVFIRGFHSLVSGKLRDWSGTQLMAYVDVADGISLSGTFHHEIREERGELGIVGLTTRLTDTIYLVSSVGSGNSAYHVPLTRFDSEVRGQLKRWPYLHYIAGAEASFWSKRRRRFNAVLGGLYLLPRGYSGEYRVKLGLADSDSSSPRLLWRTTASVVQGDHGDHQVQLRLSAGAEPAYVHNAPLEDTPNEFTVDLGLGMRRWIGPKYGLLLNGDIGGQFHQFFRVGASFALFVELP